MAHYLTSYKLLWKSLVKANFFETHGLIVVFLLLHIKFVLLAFVCVYQCKYARYILKSWSLLIKTHVKKKILGISQCSFPMRYISKAQHIIITNKHISLQNVKLNCKQNVKDYERFHIIFIKERFHQHQSPVFFFKTFMFT